MVLLLAYDCFVFVVDRFVVCCVLVRLLLLLLLFFLFGGSWLVCVVVEFVVN